MTDYARFSNKKAIAAYFLSDLKLLVVPFRATKLKGVSILLLIQMWVLIRTGVSKPINMCNFPIFLN